MKITIGTRAVGFGGGMAGSVDDPGVAMVGPYWVRMTDEHGVTIVTDSVIDTVVSFKRPSDDVGPSIGQVTLTLCGVVDFEHKIDPGVEAVEVVAEADK